ncbi:MAG TPA: stage 0 sporulation protein, partial [Clostridia bacterium]|nr:stage 0 sporulation protein [Clostridia bacterium]
MKTVIDVKFREGGKVYYFDPAGFDIKEGDGVIVETARGVEYADVSAGVHQLPDEQIVSPLKSVLRVATQADREQRDKNRAREKEAYT